jgi:hypothetical protein
VVCLSSVDIIIIRPYRSVNKISITICKSKDPNNFPTNCLWTRIWYDPVTIIGRFPLHDIHTIYNKYVVFALVRWKKLFCCTHKKKIAYHYNFTVSTLVVHVFLVFFFFLYIVYIMLYTSYMCNCVINYNIILLTPIIIISRGHHLWSKL